MKSYRSSSVVSLLLFFFIAPEFLLAQSGITFLYPTQKSVTVKTGAASIIGLFEPEEVSSLYLLRPYAVEKLIPVRSKTEKDAFAKTVKEMFPPGFILEHVSATGYLQRNGKALPNEFDFRIEDRIDLRKFWSGDEFKQVFGLMHKKKTKNVQLSLRGWLLEEKPVSTNDYQDVYDTKFSYIMVLDPGLNLFQLWKENGGKGMTFVDSIRFYHSMEVDPDGPSDEFSPELFHSVEKEESCECHDLELTEEVIADQPTVEEQCAPCHKHMLTQKSMHSPAEDYDCLLCHDPSGEQKYQLYADKDYGAALCFECHSEVEEMLSEKENAHPAAEDNCITCHDPHASQQGLLVVRRVKEVCASCHEDAANTTHPTTNHPAEGPRSPLDPEREFHCATCHNPHASDNAKLTFVPRNQLCQTCHKK